MNSHSAEFSFPPRATLALALGCLLACFNMSAADRGRELIRDPHFQGGFLLLEPKPGQRVVYGDALDTAATAKPVWDLCQWSSKFPLAAARGPWPANNDGLCFTNQAKRVCMGRPGSPDADLALGVNASVEYGNRARQTAEAPWVHLLVQQEITNPPSLAELDSCRFHVEARLNHSKLHRTADYSPSRHAAQFLIYLTVANRNSHSPGYGQFLWFGIPIYDDRSRLPPAYHEQDFAGSRMFIYTMAAEVFTKESTQDGHWVTFAQDLLPLMRQGLAAGWQRGFLSGSRDLTDYRVTNIVVGWEVPGIFDVELQLRNLQLEAQFASTPPAKPQSAAGKR